ncbi:MAG: helix-turn-helix domain-containing protein [Sterolibacterium sp.]
MSIEASLRQAHKERIARINGKAYVSSPVLLSPAPERKARAPWLAAIGDTVPTIHAVQEVVADFYGTSTALLRARRHTADLTRMRHIATFLAFELTGGNVSMIARHFGDRDRSTIHNAIRRVNQALATNKPLADELTELAHRIGARSA